MNVANDEAALSAFIAVREIVRRAVMTVCAIRDPDARFLRGGSAWAFPIIRDAKDAYGYGAASAARWQPSPHDISQMEIVTEWLSWLRRSHGEAALRRIIGWAMGVPIWRIGQREKCSERTVRNRIDRSIAAMIRHFAAADISVEIVEDGEPAASYALVVERPPGPHGEGPPVLRKVYIYDLGFVVGHKRWRDGRHRAEKFVA